MYKCYKIGFLNIIIHALSRQTMFTIKKKVSKLSLENNGNSAEKMCHSQKYRFSVANFFLSLDSGSVF